MRRFLTGDSEPLSNQTRSLVTRIARDDTVLLEGYGHNLYAERRTDGTVVIYVGVREWAWDQYPPGKRGKPTTARHIDTLIDMADDLGVDYIESAKNPATAGTPTAPGDLASIGRLGGFDGM